MRLHDRKRVKVLRRDAVTPEGVVKGRVGVESFTGELLFLAISPYFVSWRRRKSLVHAPWVLHALYALYDLTFTYQPAVLSTSFVCGYLQNDWLVILFEISRYLPVFHYLTGGISARENHEIYLQYNHHTPKPW